MSKATKHQPSAFGAQEVMMFGGLAIVLVAVIPPYLALLFGSRWAGVNGAIPLNPFEVIVGLFRKTYVWPVQSTILLVGIYVLLVALVVLVLRARMRRTKGRTRVDDAAKYMGRGRDVATLSAKNATAKAADLGVAASIGVPIGSMVFDGQRLYGSWEDMHCDIMGPRSGKTTARVIPAILNAPGAVLVTSNKRDVVDHTRLPREQAGTVWVFDPQGIAFEQPTWWWNPLSYVTDETKAAKLADHFASGSRASDAKTDAYFEPAGQDLLTAMILAAAVGDRPITDVYAWLSDQANETPAELLKRNGEYPLILDGLLGVMALHPEQRGGIYGTALQMASALRNRQIAQWVAPLGGDVADERRPAFNPHEFVRGANTLYSLSREGKGSAGPLVLALTAAVVEAAEELATTLPRGRLQTPLLGVLDEAANICRWSTLPDLYSHYGSRGIVLMTILQSWSQGCEVWGERGMKKLWSASNVRVVGRGVDDSDFLRHVSEMIGDYHYQQYSTSSGRGGSSTSQSASKERILDVAELGAMPEWRAVVFGSGSRPTLVRLEPWFRGPKKADVDASKARYEPVGAPAPALIGGPTDD